MSLALVRRSGLSLRQALLMRAVAIGAEQLGASWVLGGGSSCGSSADNFNTPAAAAASLLWRYDSPLRHHLSTAAQAQASSAEIPGLPPFEVLKQRAATATSSSQAPQPLELAGVRRAHFEALLRNFQQSGAVKDQALALYVNSKLYAEAVPQFKEFLLAVMDPQLCSALMHLKVGEASQEALFPYFAQFVLERYVDDIKAYRDVVQTVDLRKPHQWFPMARALQRRIVYHAGPTNSGKTYNALQAMRAAQTGVYCGPLRLLAMEVYDSCNSDGLYCNLITGQERREVPGAGHTACTVEMVNMQHRVDVAVIDEIQMIGDDSRGWAWTRALMGVPANEVHLCGDGSALPLVRKICEDMGEPLEVHSYERFTSLEVEPEGLEGGYGAVQPGDCIVAFSRKEIYAIKQLIEQETKHRACVVYGALPPETRRQQAKLFNEPDNAYRVLVASDAVGMGLNLNIRRIIFNSVTKREGGNKQVPVSISMLKQIAGRAGRRSSQWSQGLATCLSPGDVPRLHEALLTPLDQLATPKAGLFPEFEHFEVFAGQRPDESYSALLEAFEREALLDSDFFFCKQESVVAAAQLLGQLDLSIRDMFNFCMAPASASDLRIAAALLNFATKYSQGLPVTLDISVPSNVPASVEELRHMETAHQVVMLWLWLSYRFDAEVFPMRDKIQAKAEHICELLDKGLKRLTRMSKSGVSIAELPARPAHERILDCFSGELGMLEEQRRKQRSWERRQKGRDSQPCSAPHGTAPPFAGAALEAPQHAASKQRGAEQQEQRAAGREPQGVKASGVRLDGATSVAQEQADQQARRQRRRQLRRLLQEQQDHDRIKQRFVNLAADDGDTLLQPNFGNMQPNNVKAVPHKPQPDITNANTGWQRLSTVLQRM